MRKISKFQFIILNITVFVLMFFSGFFFDILTKLFITSLFFLISSFYLFNKSPFSRVISFIIIFVPILLIYGVAYIYDLIQEDGFIGKPFFWSYLLIAILVYISKIYKISEKKIIYFFIPFCILLTAYVYYSSIENEKENIELSQSKSAKFIDKMGNKYFLNSFKGKLILFEFWTTSCVNCPESIADFHELADQYKSNKNIDFRVVNINLGKRHNEKMFDKIESKIKLEKLYTNEDIFKSLNFNTTPYVLVLDAQGKIVYFGYPNFNKLTQNYLPSLIKKELAKM